MFTPVHRVPVLVGAVLCALLFLGALPLVARSQEEPLTSADTAAPESPTNTSLLNLYPTEGIPGGGSVGDFVVGPGMADITIQPGETKTVTMTVTNRTGERRRFKLTVEDATGSQNPTESILLLGNDRGPYSMKDYVSVPYTEFELDDGQRARIPVTVSLPADAEPGGLYGSVLVQTLAVEALAGDTAGTVPQSAIIARVGTLFFITIPGAVEHDGALQDFSTVPKESLYADGPIKFGILFSNDGSTHLAPYGELVIRNMFGEEVGNLVLEPWFVMPQSLRLREVTWNRELLMGRYTATVRINRSYEDIVDEISYSFWVLPWKPILGGFAVIFLIIFIIRAFFKRFEFKRKT